MNSAPYRIVIVDDSPEDRADLRRLLLTGSPRHYRFIEAATGVAGLRACLDSADGPPDCVLLDYHLPDCDAPEMLAALGGYEHPYCPVVVVTGSTGGVSGPAMLRAGAQDFIGKSWMNPESLTRTVENAIERFTMVRELRASETRLRVGTEVAGFAVAEVDYPSLSVRLSPEATRLLGLGDKAMTISRDKMHALFHPDDCIDIQDRIENALDPNGSGWFAMDHRFVTPSGEVRWLSIRKQVFFRHYPDGSRPDLAILALSDISERKAAEDQLQEQAERLQDADRRKDEFLAMLAHELRNPLAPIRNAVHILRRVGGNEPQLVWCRDLIARQIEHLARLVDDLLDVSRITRGRIELKKEPLNLLDIVQRAVETSRPLIDARQHKLLIQLPTEPVRVEGDLVRLAQVVSNLLNNAAKYTDPGGEITLNAALEGGQVAIRVRDTGQGIDPYALSRLFDLFYQVDYTLDRSEGGLGIGLSLVKRLVEMHGGSVAAYSAGRGCGSEFVIRLARLPEVSAAPDTADLPVTVQGGLRILVVDDDHDSVESMALLLRFDGHEVQTAHNGRDAVHLALSWRPDVVLLDIGLPGWNGYEACRRIREGGLHEALMIAITGYGQDEDRRLAREAGFDAHQIKPVDTVAIQALLAAVPWKPSMRATRE